jgi:hypothetical protein
MPRAEPGSNWTGQETSLIGGVWEQQTRVLELFQGDGYRIGACTYAGDLDHRDA